MQVDAATQQQRRDTIEAVIFDVGGVLTTSPVSGITAFAERSGLHPERFRSLFRPANGAWSRFERGELTEAGFVTAFEAEAQNQGLAVDASTFLASFLNGTQLRPEMLAIVEELRRRGYRLGCITNNVQASKRQFPLILAHLFDVVIESSKVGLRKPDAAIYRLACAQLGIEPQQAIFLDDFGVNLKAARALGMTTIKVDDSGRAIEELEDALGVQLPRLIGEEKA